MNNFIKEHILADWVQSWRNSKFIFWLDAIGVLSSIIASIVFNVGMPYPNLLLTLLLYTVGSIALVTTSYLKHDSWMLTLMGWYTFINFVGLYKFL